MRREQEQETTRKRNKVAIEDRCRIIAVFLWKMVWKKWQRVVVGRG